MRVLTRCEAKELYGDGEYLGSGAFGSCVKGRDPRTGEEVVLKSFRHGCLHCLVHEAEVLRALRRVPGMQQLRGVCVKTEQLVSLFAGATLCSYFRERQRSTATTLSVFLQIARTLQAISRIGYVHNDIKSDNVCAREHEESGAPQVTVIDVGMAFPVDISSQCPLATATVEDSNVPPGVLHGRGRCGENSDIRGIAAIMQGQLPYLGRRPSLEPVHEWARRGPPCLAVLVRVLKKALKEEGEEGDGGGDGEMFH